MSVDPNLTPDPEATRIAALLRALSADAPPPDSAFLAELQQRSATVFAAATAPTLSTETSNTAAPTRSRMFTLLSRGVVALLATAALLAMCFGPDHFRPWAEPQARAAVPFSVVLDELRSAKSLRLRVSQADRTADVWIRGPGLVRWEESPQHYTIAAGSRFWKVDESTNTVTTGDSPWFQAADQQVDLLALLDLGVSDASALLSAEPLGRETVAGRTCLVYRVDLPGKAGPLQIEAYADAETRVLVGLLARPAGKPRDAAPPLAELQLLALNEPLADDKFTVATSLSEDGRIGKVTHGQGIVVLRPMLAKRWTPVCRDLVLKPGDWIRAELRGANAVQVTLTSGVELILGPGTLVECVSPAAARIHTGSVQVAVPAAGKPFELLAPRTGSRSLAAAQKQLVRVTADETLVDVAQQPLWLAGFLGATNNESLGSLVVNLPDGRNEPLTVGYHKVNVEIRDQIARTTIEESFVNHTASRLEGIFHFPLPADASISGFGMWIGNDLVEADIVEKQRAREIFETILREKRDPGLLEWTGGNLFKARVFPIEPHAEKRIKIVYTQVLPVRAGRYRYTYGLRSDLLRTKPLRELALNVTVQSALPLKSIACPTHTVRTNHTEHAATVEFSAQEYTPTRDFEVVCELDAKQSDVVVIPHRRGADGYFLLQLTPPAPEGNWQREVLPEGQPLDLVMLCDTSASMDQTQRREQAEFVATVLATLGPQDRFNLAATDVATRFAFPAAVAVTPQNVTQAEAFLAGQLSLGWTNLEQAYAAVLKQASPTAQVIYIGDGLVTAGDRDPARFVKRLGQLVAGAQPAAAKDKAVQPGRGFHAVAVGNVQELTVLRGIAALSGGSARAIAGEQTPQQVALELLNELARRALRNLQVEFRGLQVAAVYPEQLPNLAAGTQQILVGRYLPTGADQAGEVVITGQRDTETVRYVARVNLAAAEAGNSFIPRLWARSHLDHLLAQGSAELVRDEIIALSEEFHIITPYTSLLVLESDADRQRFGVQRKFLMRDGEQFFAAGKRQAELALLQQQMKLAGEWRIGLRREALRKLASLGREDQRSVWQPLTLIVSQTQDIVSLKNASRSMFGVGTGGVDESWLWSASPASSMRGKYAEDGWSGGGVGAFKERNIERFSRLEEEGRKGGKSDVDLNFAWDVDNDFDGVLLSVGKKEDLAKALEELDESSEWDGAELGERVAKLKRYGGTRAAPQRDSQALFAYFSEEKRERYQEGYLDLDAVPGLAYWLQRLLPVLSPPALQPAASHVSSWPPEALALAKSLLRTESLRNLPGGVVVQQRVELVNPRWNRQTWRNTTTTLIQPQAWLQRNQFADSQHTVEYCTAIERGIYARPWQLGSVRKADATDLRHLPLELHDYSVLPLQLALHRFQARVEPAGADRALLVLFIDNKIQELRFLIDTKRSVLLRYEQWVQGELQSTLEYQNFVEVAGSWWATLLVQTDDQGRVTERTTIAVEALTAPQFAARWQTETAEQAQVLNLPLPLPTLAVARQKVADGRAGYADHLVMLRHFAGRQQWDDAVQQLDQIERLAADKPGVHWLRTTLYATIRRQAEARERLLTAARELAANPQPEDLALAKFILTWASMCCGPAENSELVELLKPIYARQPAELNAMADWYPQQLQCLDELQRPAEALALAEQLAKQTPWNVPYQINYADRLQRAGKPDLATAWLRAQLARQIELTPDEDQSLRGTLANQLQAQNRGAELLAFTQEWLKLRPETTVPYHQYLGALRFNERGQEADQLVETWLTESRMPGKLSPSQLARLSAAIDYAQQNRHGWNEYRLGDRWSEPLAATVRFFARHPEHFEVGTRVYYYRFWDSPVSDSLRGDFLHWLQTDQAQLSPAQIGYFVSMAQTGRLQVRQPIGGRTQLQATDVPADVWQAIATPLRQRWAAEADPTKKHYLGEALLTIYQTRFSTTELLPFLRDRVASAPADYRTNYQMRLSGALLDAAWTAANEREAFALLGQMSKHTEPILRLEAQLPTLQIFIDKMLAKRLAAAEQQWQAAGDTHQLTRPQLAAKRAELVRQTRQAFAAQLGTWAAEDNGPLAPWLRMERGWLDVPLGLRLPEIQAECWAILGAAPPAVPKELTAADRTVVAETTRDLQALLQGRAFAVVAYLATQPKADPALVARVLQYLDAGVALGGEATVAWRQAKFQILVALDRPDDLERDLRKWIVTSESTAPWRVILGKLLAERGLLPPAIALFEAVQKDKLLTAADYQQLADWYLATDRRDAYEATRWIAFQQRPEPELANYIDRQVQRWRATGAARPTEVNEETLLALRVLLAKSAYPERHLSDLNELYLASREVRLLECIADACLGRTPEQIYRLLESDLPETLAELRNEAATDAVLGRLQTLRKNPLSPADARALDLLEALVECKAAQVFNQRGPHVKAAVEALQRAFARDWLPGEGLHMAQLLGNLDDLPDAALRDEQVRELRVLQQLAPSGSRDRLRITMQLAKVLSELATTRAEGLREMESAVRQYEAAQPGQWPPADNDVLATFAQQYRALGQYAAGETMLQRFLAKSQQREQRAWLRQQRFALYLDALRTQGEVSLGSGQILFEKLIAALNQQLTVDTDSAAQEALMRQLLEAFESADELKLTGVRERTRTFAFQTLPTILPRVADWRLAGVPVSTFAKILGPAETVRYMVEQFEAKSKTQPDSSAKPGDVFGSSLALYLDEAKKQKQDLGDLPPRLLKLTLQQLRSDLQVGNPISQQLYYQGYSFWAEHADDFAKVADEVYAERRGSGRHVEHIARYVWDGLGRRPQAIEMLLLAHTAGVLDRPQQQLLVNYLQQAERSAETIPLLEQLLPDSPDNLSLRTQLMQAYARSQRVQQLQGLLKATDEHFHRDGRWQPVSIAALGAACVQCNLNTAAANYYREAIAIYQRQFAQASAGSAQLSEWYRGLAQAEMQQGNTDAAVDAALAAVVCWSPRQVHERTQALAQLQSALGHIKDLPAYIRKLDAQVATTGQDSPLIRQGLGGVLMQQKKWSEALAQLQLALELQPHDKAIYLQLIQCCDALERPADGTQYLLRLLDFQRHDLTLYQQLVTRMQHDPANLERALTTLIEAGPNEAEHHAALAELREQRDQWNEAAVHWQEVAQLRNLEPTGLLRLAAAQLHLKQWDAARQSIATLRKTAWPARFDQVGNETDKLAAQLPK